MRVLLSGSSGLIGTALTQALNARGDDVVALVRTAPAAPDASKVFWDPQGGVLSLDELNAAGPIDAIVHMAGAGIGDKRWTTARKQEILNSRVASTALLAERATQLDRPPSVFLSGSAIGIYGFDAPGIVTESSPQGKGFLAEVCAQWEGAAQPLVNSDIRTAFARTGIVLSSQGGALAKQLLLFRLGLGGTLGSGAQWLSWISLADEVAALLRILDDGQLSGPINLTAPNPVTNKEFTKILGHVLHRPTIARAPKLALSLVLGEGLTKEALFSSARVQPEVLLQEGFSFAHPDCASAVTSALSQH